MEDSNAKQHKSNNWPELESTRLQSTASQVLAKELVKEQGESIRILLVKKSKTLLATAAITLLLGVQNSYFSLSYIIDGHIDIQALILGISSIINLIVFIYFLKAKDPEITALVLKLLIVYYGISLFIGFIQTVLVLPTVIILILMIISYFNMSDLKYGR